MNNKNIMDITANVKQIEGLKSKILSDIAVVFEIMAEGSVEKREIDLKFAEIIMNSYILAGKLGFSYDEILENIFSKLKLEILSRESVSDYNELSDWLRNRASKN